MRRLFILFILAVLLVGSVASEAAADAGWYKLIAGQNYYVGNVRVTIDADGDLHVVYVAAQGYCLEEIHTHAAYTLDGIPQKNGNPRPGQFYYKDEDLGCAYRAEAVIPGPWTASPDNPIYVAAHAVVRMPDGTTETGWGVWCGMLDKYGFPGNNWAVYIYYTGVYPPGFPE